MLTDEQKTTLKAAIMAETDATFVEYRNGGRTTAMAAWLNQAASPAFYVWKPSLTSDEARAAISGGGGLAQLDNLTAGKRDSLLWVFQSTTFPANSAQRTAIDDLCGTQNVLKAAILAAQKRTASIVEKLFATGTGSDASPATLVFAGQLSGDDVAAALSS